MNENKISEPTPEQLLQVLELQLQMQRAKRRQSARSRTAIRVGGILLILGGAAHLLEERLHFAAELFRILRRFRQRMTSVMSDCKTIGSAALQEHGFKRVSPKVEPNDGCGSFCHEESD